jgi:hypothetical protein
VGQADQGPLDETAMSAPQSESGRPGMRWNRLSGRVRARVFRLACYRPSGLLRISSSFAGPMARDLAPSGRR